MPLLRPQGHANLLYTLSDAISARLFTRLPTSISTTRSRAKPTSLKSRNSPLRRGSTSTANTAIRGSVMSQQSGQDGPTTGAADTAQSDTRLDLTSLSPAELIAHITDLETRLKSTTARLAALSITGGGPGAGGERDTNSPTEEATTAAPFVLLGKNGKIKKPSRTFDFSRYSTRRIALKFAYLGQRYNGLEHTNGGTPSPRPTVEEALWKALRKARLIPPDVPDGCDASFEVVYGEIARKRLYTQQNVKLDIDWTGLDYSKCGRTDKGVSAFGQVVGVRVRSNRPKEVDKHMQKDLAENGSGNEPPPFDDVKDELPYISVLNSILPSDIRILAWCPNVDETFDARFSCRERQYKYFFTNPAFCPLPGSVGLTHANGQKADMREGWLDIDAMRKAAKKLEGLHDFRNFCKIDASKQMSGCERRITYANIEETPGGVDLTELTRNSTLNQYENSAGPINSVLNSLAHVSASVGSPQGPKVYAFAVHGTAFLWHQVRCMVAVLFLVGQGLEQPELVDELLDIVRNPEKPQYEMADDSPLVLWNCVFPSGGSGDNDAMRWIYAGDESSVPALTRKGDSPYDGKFGVGGLVNGLWAEWREAKMKETLTAGLMSLALSQGDGTSLQRGGFRAGADLTSRSQRVFAGDNDARNVGEYVPVMQKERLGSLEVQNTKYLNGKQARRDLKKSQAAEEC